MYESVSGTISNSVFAIQFSHKDTRKDETRRKHQNAEDENERRTKKEQREKERKKDLSLSLSLCVSSTIRRVHTWLGQFTTWKCIFLSFFLSFSRERRINEMKNSEENFFFCCCCCEKRSCFFCGCFFKKMKVFCTRDFFFSLFLQPFWKNDTTLAWLSADCKKESERERFRERERGSSFVNSSERPSRVRHLGSTAVPARFRDQFLFLNSVSSISLLSRVLSYVNFSTQLLLN